MNEPHTNDTDRASSVERLLGDQVRLCQRLEVLGSQQRECIERRETETLLRLLGERQDLIGELRAAQDALAPYNNEWESLLSRLPAARRAAIQATQRELEAKVGGILSRDDDDRRALETRRGKIVAQMAEIKQGQGAVAAYGGARGYTTPRFQDGEA